MVEKGGASVGLCAAAMLWGSRSSASKSDHELLADIGAALKVIDGKAPGDADAKARRAYDQAVGDITQHLTSLKGSLETATPADGEPDLEVLGQLGHGLVADDRLLQLNCNLARLEFEARKDVAQIVRCLLMWEASSSVMVQYWLNTPAALEQLVSGYRDPEIAVNCGIMLRDAARAQPELARQLLYSPAFDTFFDFVVLVNFDVCSDAFQTFKELLTVHKAEAATFLSDQYAAFFPRYNELLASDNYVTRRLSLKLLSELLLERANFGVMRMYISDPSHLKLVMQRLVDKSKSIQFEAFHVFKVFVANPNKPASIENILFKNKDKLLSFLQDHMHCPREDEQFFEERDLCLQNIRAAQLQMGEADSGDSTTSALG